LQGQLQNQGALETAAQYLAMLQEAYLVALNSMLLSAMHPDGPPDPAKEPPRFGAWVENACLAFAVNQGQRVRYWREAPLEIDAVFEGSWGHWASKPAASTYTP